MKAKTFFLVSLFFVVFSFYPTIYEWQKKDTLRPDRDFELVHNFYTDFNFYLSRIRQGLEGNLTVHEKYTSEPHSGSFIQIMYLAMGWVGKWLRVPWHRTSDIYHMSRLVLGMALLLVTAAISKRSFKTYGWQMAAFILAISASTYPKLVTMDDGSIRLGGYMAWWSVMDSLQRITFIPHLIAGQGLMAFLLLKLSDISILKKGGSFIFLGILGFVLGIIFPPGLLFVIAACGMFLLVEAIQNINNIIGKKLPVFVFRNIMPRAAFVILSVPALAYLALMTSFFPWKQLALADIIRPLPFKYFEYFQGMGIVFPLGAAGLLLSFVKKEKQMVMPSVWVLTWMALLFIFNFIPQQSPLRFSEMIPHVPLAILSVYLFMIFAEKLQLKRIFFPKFKTSTWHEVQGKTFEVKLLIFIRNWLSEIKNWVKELKINFSKILRYEPPIKVIAAAFPYVLLALIFAVNIWHMYSSWLWQRDFVHHKIRATIPLVPAGSTVMYPLKDVVKSFYFIQDNSKRDDVILAGQTIGNYIPVYAGNYVYIGHDNTVNAEEKRLFVNSFYSGNMNQDQAYDWVKTERFKFIYHGPQEKEIGGVIDLAEVYPFLTPVFQGEYVTIYSVK